MRKIEHDSKTGCKEVYTKHLQKIGDEARATLLASEFLNDYKNYSSGKAFISIHRHGFTVPDWTFLNSENA